MPLPVRKHPRLKSYDYSQCGCYHLTLCTKHRQPILSRILSPVDETARARVQLLHAGEVTEFYLRRIPEVYAGVHLIHYVIMPNHVHLLLLLDPDAAASIPTVVHSLKRMVSRKTGASIWQDSFYDVVIRSESMLHCEWEYIDSNPDKWLEDRYYISV